ncbi:MAG TPA: GntR family transcriptional regulator [Thermoplasmataceae archaeon]|nr:GntR family transcriptional regulator [Thermoplasmatales archaeon AK]HLH85845.1 GntR family transcriptional regulator [Thermoplasmataceae archaeon]
MNEELSSLTESAYKYIFESIMNGNFRAGQSISPDNIVKTLNISKTPVREALLQLEAEGLISRNGRFYNVIFLSEKEVLELYEVRMILEAEAAALACDRITDAELSVLWNVLDMIKAAVNEKNPDPIKLADLNGKFHSLIAAACKNSYIVEYTSNIRLKLKIVRTTLFTSYDRRQDEVAEHEAILKAIERRDPDLAKGRVKSHMQKLMSYLKNNVFGKIY